MSVTAVIVLMLAFVLSFIAVDIWLYLDKKEGNTYSEILERAGEKWTPLIMLICYGFGLLSGHWWW